MKRLDPAVIKGKAFDGDLGVFGGGLVADGGFHDQLRFASSTRATTESTSTATVMISAPAQASLCQSS